MNKFLYTLILTSLVVFSSAQTLTFSSKTARVFVDSANINMAIKYITDTIKISKSDPNDTIMYFNYDNSLYTNHYCSVIGWDETDHTPHSLADNTIIKNALWGRFGFNTGYMITTRGLYWARGVVYLKHNPTIRDTVTFFLQMAPTGITTNSFKPTNPIYPNPAITEIRLDENASVVRIIDNLGKEVIYQDLNSNKTLDISFLTPGVYFLESLSKNGVVREKLIKN